MKVLLFAVGLLALFTLALGYAPDAPQMRTCCLFNPMGYKMTGSLRWATTCDPGEAVVSSDWCEETIR
jgi:hypothetical protein